MRHEYTRGASLRARLDAERAFRLWMRIIADLAVRPAPKVTTPTLESA